MARTIPNSVTVANIRTIGGTIFPETYTMAFGVWVSQSPFHTYGSIRVRFVYCYRIFVSAEQIVDGRAMFDGALNRVGNGIPDSKRD